MTQDLLAYLVDQAMEDPRLGGMQLVIQRGNRSTTLAVWSRSHESHGIHGMH